MAIKENELIKKPNTPIQMTPEEISELMKCADPITGPKYFMKNYYYIRHPVKGKLIYEPFDYQDRMIDIFNNYRKVINLVPRQMGKTTTAAGYLLWYAMFVPNSTILVAAHKFSGAQEIMNMIRYGYESVPDFIRAGVTTYNKGSLEFDNGSRIVSSATTENTGRGMAISLLYCDELGFLRNTIAKAFWTSISPTLATGGRCIITSTPNSDEDQFAQLWKGANKCVDEYGNPTDIGHNGFKAFRAFWEEHPDRDDKWAADQIAELGQERFDREFGCITGDSQVTIKWPNNTVQNVYILELNNILDSQNQSQLIKNTLNLQVLTDSGYSKFDGVAIKGKQQTINLDVGNKSISCTADHKFYFEDKSTVEAGNLVVGDKVITNSGIETVSSTKIANVELVYDLINVEKNNRYYANNILISNCEFLIWEETLINANKLTTLEGIDPIEKQGQIRWYKKPEADKTYVVSLDPSLGTGGDASAIQVLELPTFVQVAEWQHNKTMIKQQIFIIKAITEYLATIVPENNIYYSIENNTIGEAGLLAISEIGEENFKGIFLSEPNKKGVGKRYRKGFTTSNNSKLNACSKLKQLVETKKLTIYSKNLISELKTYVAVGNSFAAKPGEHDDLVSSLLLAIRMSQSLQRFDSDIDSAIRGVGGNDDYREPFPFFVL